MKDKNNAVGRDQAGARTIARTDSSISTTKWLIGMLSEVDPSYFADEIPERDLQMADAAGSAAIRDQAGAVNVAHGASNVPLIAKRLSNENRDQAGAVNVAHPHSNWKLVAAVSGFTAACSAAVTGVVVFACMRHFHSFDGV